MSYYPAKNWKLKLCEPLEYGFDMDTSLALSFDGSTLSKSKERIVFDGNYTIYYDRFGGKTVVHKMEDELYDAEKAVLYALLKSKGVKPKEVQDLIANAIDREAKRKEREAKKEQAKQTAKKPVEIEVTQTKKGVRIDLSKIDRSTDSERVFKALAETIAKQFK